MKLYCPYCTKEITLETSQCPSCGTKYQSETLVLLNEIVRVVMEEDFSERRIFDRIPRKFKITYATPKALLDHFLGNLSQGGVFIPTNDLMEPGTKFTLKIFLPDGKEELEVLCEVIWKRKEEELTPKGKFPPGIGVKFVNLSPVGKERVDKICREGRTEADKFLGKKGKK